MEPGAKLIDSVAIRAYRDSDREVIRRICCDTADRGEPVEHFFPDREVFADLLTGYYTDHNPESLWVVDAEGQAVGYLSGCLDDRHYERVMVLRVLPRAIFKAIGRGILFSRQVRRLFIAILRTSLQDHVVKKASRKQYTAHLHLNLQASFRGRGIGRRLLSHFLEHAKSYGVNGVHASVRADNLPSCRLFESMEFSELERHRVIWPSGESYETHDTLIYGKTF